MDALGLPFLLVLGLAVGGVAYCMMLALTSSSAGQLAKRAERIAARSRGEAPIAALNLRRSAEGGFDTMMKRLLPRPELLRERLKRTGKSIGIGAYALSCAGVALAALVGALFL